MEEGTRTMDSMNIQKYKAFIKTVECGSFTKASELLNYSQSAVSRMIDDLEKEWNVSLLERIHTGVKLTSDGIKLLPYARKVCDEYDGLQSAVDEINGLQSGIIRIGTFSSVATHWIPKIIKRFQKDYPNIEYELLLGDYSETENRIMEGRVDCGFLLQPASPQVQTMFLEKDRLLAVLPKNHPLADCVKFPIKSFCDYPFLLLEKGGKCEAREILEKYKVFPKIRFTTWDDYAIMSMVENGLGISILPELILKRNPYKIVTKELDVPAYREICFAVRDKKRLSAAVKAFIEYLQFR